MSRRLVVEADGGSRGNPGPAGYGALVRDAATGEVLGEAAQAIGVATNNVAEYGGLVAGLRLAAEVDPTAQVEVRMDSKLVVEQMSGRWKIKHEDMRRLAMEARAVLPYDQVRYTWVPRAQNSAADKLANEAMDLAAAGRQWSRPAAVDDDGGDGSSSSRPDGADADGPAQSQAHGAHLWGTADQGEPTRLLLLRHGVTEATLARRFSGSGGADLALTDEGRAQASSAAARIAALTGGEVAAVVCSPMRRAVETGRVVAARLGLQIRTDDAWSECDFGEWDGLTSAEVRERWPEELAAWQGSDDVAPPGGEPFSVVARRVAVARDRLMARHPRRTVVVVTHVTPIKQVVRDVLGAPAAALWRLDLSPASLTTARFWADGGASLVSYNDTSHLD